MLRTTLRPALVLFGLLTLLTGVFYPLLVTGIAQWLFPRQANGSVLERAGQPGGSALIGQPFSAPGYFWGRLSATADFPYNAAASGGANLGPYHPALRATAQARLTELRQADPDNPAPVPLDLLTASGSGLDPHISPAAAEYQAARVARVRGLTLETVQQLIAEATEDRTCGLLGEPRVNVLQLNLALDALTQP